MDRKRFARALIYLFESKMKTAGENTIQVWYDLLKEYQEEDVIKAIVDLTVSSDQFVNAGMIIDRLRPNSDAEAEMAWQEALASAQDAGRRPIKSKTAIALNSIGGMFKLRDSELDEIQFLRKAFKDAYLSLKNFPSSVCFCDGLQAQIDRENSCQGLSENVLAMVAQVGKKIEG